MQHKQLHQHHLLLLKIQIKDVANALGELLHYPLHPLLHLVTLATEEVTLGVGTHVSLSAEDDDLEPSGSESGSESDGSLPDLDPVSSSDDATSYLVDVSSWIQGDKLVFSFIINGRFVCRLHRLLFRDSDYFLHGFYHFILSIR